MLVESSSADFWLRVDSSSSASCSSLVFCPSSSLLFVAASSVEPSSVVVSSFDELSCGFSSLSTPLSSSSESEDGSVASPLSLLSSLSSLSEDSEVGVMGSLFWVSRCESLSSLLPLLSDSDEPEFSSPLLLLLLLLPSLLDSSPLSKDSRADVVDVEVLSCAGRRGGRSVEVMFCASTELWLISLGISMTVVSISSVVIAPNLSLIIFFSKATI
jgi:hypothetical protein